MKFATVRQLKNQTSEILRDAAAGKDVLVTRHGRPLALLHGLTQDELEEYVLAHDPTLRASIEEARREAARGGGMTLAEVRRRLKKRERKGRARVHR